MLNLQLQELYFCEMTKITPVLEVGTVNSSYPWLPHLHTQSNVERNYLRNVASILWTGFLLAIILNLVTLSWKMYTVCNVRTSLEI